jgi:hypothetical protein
MGHCYSNAHTFRDWYKLLQENLDLLEIIDEDLARFEIERIVKYGNGPDDLVYEPIARLIPVRDQCLDRIELIRVAAVKVYAMLQADTQNDWINYWHGKELDEVLKLGMTEFGSDSSLVKMNLVI